MPIEFAFIIATFTAPETISVTPQSMLWLLPLTVAIAVVYKAVNLPKIAAVNFIKETAVLLGSIIVFMAITTVVLYIIARLTTS